MCGNDGNPVAARNHAENAAHIVGEIDAGRLELGLRTDSMYRFVDRRTARACVGDQSLLSKLCEAHGIAARCYVIGRQHNDERMLP